MVQSTPCFARNVRNANNLAVSLQSMAITGHTNINSFWLKYADHESAIKGTSDENLSEGNVRALSFNIPFRGFVFSNSLMRNDFLKMVKASVYPDIPVQIKGLKDFSELKDDSQELVEANITLAGITRLVTLTCKVKKTDQNTFQIRGSKSLALSDFNIIAPSKFFGMVKVNDEISISFDLKLSAGN